VVKRCLRVCLLHLLWIWRRGSETLLQRVHQAPPCMPSQETRISPSRKVWVSERSPAPSRPLFPDDCPIRLHKLQLPLHSPTSSTSSGPATPYPPPPAYMARGDDLKLSPSFSIDQNSLYASYFKELPDTPTSPTTFSPSHCSSPV